MEYTKGEFYSWRVINEETIIKTGDKSFFEHKGSGVPKEIKWFFNADTLQYGNTKIIKLIHRKNEFEGRIEIDRLERCRIFWHSDLSELFNNYYNKKEDEFPLIRFCMLLDDVYEVEFIDAIMVSEEKEEPYETVIPQKEGKRKEYYVTKYERNPVNRKKAIEIHGTKCMICGFDFEAVYGEVGRNFIEVHHIKPLAEVGEEIEINPETDLVCICANCHRIIHRKKDKIYSVDEVKEMISNKSLRLLN